MNEDDAFAGKILDFPRKQIRNSTPRCRVRKIGLVVLVPRQRAPADVDDTRVGVGNDPRHRGANPAGATGNEDEVCNHHRSVGNPVSPGTRGRLVREGSERDNLCRGARTRRPRMSRAAFPPTVERHTNRVRCVQRGPKAMKRSSPISPVVLICVLAASASADSVERSLVVTATAYNSLSRANRCRAPSGSLGRPTRSGHEGDRSFPGSHPRRSRSPHSSEDRGVPGRIPRTRQDAQALGEANRHLHGTRHRSGAGLGEASGGNQLVDSVGANGSHYPLFRNRFMISMGTLGWILCGGFLMSMIALVGAITFALPETRPRAADLATRRIFSRVASRWRTASHDSRGRRAKRWRGVGLPLGDGRLHLILWPSSNFCIGTTGTVTHPRSRAR